MQAFVAAFSAGFEPAVFGLGNRCSSSELREQEVTKSDRDVCYPPGSLSFENAWDSNPDRIIYSDVVPIEHSPQWIQRDLNSRPSDCEPDALPAELWTQVVPSPDAIPGISPVSAGRSTWHASPSRTRRISGLSYSVVGVIGVEPTQTSSQS